ncbi:MAG: SDR family NAD(P)-dependent oxidoreductase [Mariprofundaceae bacterium]
MRSVLITGASGGFGHEFARQLEPLEYRLILHGRDKARLQLTLGALKHPDRHCCITADLATQVGIELLIEQTAHETALSGLINNAGFGVWGLFEQGEIALQADVLETDLIAPVRLTHALLPRLIKNRGFIINVSSLAGETPLPHMSTYAAAKAGLTYWSEALRAETDIPVVTLAPGPSPTGFRDVSGMPERMGSVFRTSATTVVTASLDTLRRGGGYCVPGLRHRLLWSLQKIVPRRLALSIMAKHLQP